MTNRHDAEELRRQLDLQPHPTCGFVHLTWVSPTPIAPGGLPEPFADGRPTGSALLFQVTPDHPVHLHCIRNDQIYHRYLGAPLEVLLLRPDGTHAVEVMGDDLAAGQHLQLLIPGSTFHTARLLSGGEWFVGGSTEWPGVDPADVVVGEREVLARSHPGAAALLDDFLGSAQLDRPI